MSTAPSHTTALNAMTPTGTTTRVVPHLQRILTVPSTPCSHKNLTQASSTSSTPFPTPQVSPSSSCTQRTSAKRTTMTTTLQSHTIKQLQVTQPFTITVLPTSPACSIATQTADLLADWTEDGASRGKGASPTHASIEEDLESTKAAPAAQCSVGTATPTGDDMLQGSTAVIMSLVMTGDQHWETTNPRRCKTKAAKTNIQHTITGVVQSLWDGGLLRDEVVTTMVVYLRRLSAKHVKYVSRFTIKKYLVAACMVANKTCSDQYYSLNDYAAATGLSKQCIVEGEVQFLTNLDYDVQTGILDHDQPVGFFQTSVLIHDMTIAAAAAVLAAQPDEVLTPHCIIEEDASQVVMAPTGPASIASIVEGILATAEARV